MENNHPVRIISTAEKLNCWKSCPLAHACVKILDPKLDEECIVKIKDQFGSGVDVRVTNPLNPCVRIEAGGYAVAYFRDKFVFPDHSL